MADRLGCRKGIRVRTYLVIMDETDEARKALRFASRRALTTGGNVHILALVAKQNFSAFGAVQATIEEEARDRAEVLASSAAGNLFSESGKMPTISVKTGEGQAVIKDYLGEHPEVAALVLGAAAEGQPGPLISHFSAHSGSLPCPLYIVPGSFSNEEIDRLTA
ncbi:universal stress protein [Altererythrobacter aestiaquae]|uniref:Universal stress protein n=1 Tax=Pontixanthobacter aestiaquae TaxID=1509367 RepID=A0A844Z4I7_9SPHN|nr:universal stress protein [Pontixanthobacter aestiaquae]